MTRRIVLEREEPKFQWVDVVAPSHSELADIAREYGLHATSVHDCLDPEHLPKYERIGTTTFMIVRVMDDAAGEDCASVHDMTRKVAVFFGPGFLLTVHRVPQPFLERLESDVKERQQGSGPLMPRLLLDLINAAIDSFGKPMEVAERAIEQFETTLFRDDEDLGELLQRVYHQKQRVTLIKRLLLHTMDAVQKLSPPADASAPLYQDTRENINSMYVYADELIDDVSNLLSIHLALASHRTNEVVRVLTVFSVFFLPLTFIVGVYGMNFRFMPELQHRLGYPGVWAVMVLVTVLIFVWFRRRGWLRS